MAVWAPPLLAFHSLRALQTAGLAATILACFGCDLNRIRSDFSEGGRSAWLILLVTAAPIALSLFATLATWLFGPATLPEKVLQAWAMHIGIEGQCFPEVEHRERPRLEAMALLPKVIRSLAVTDYTQRQEVQEDSDVAS